LAVAIWSMLLAALVKPSDTAVDQAAESTPNTAST
jgi:hypothetical protein